MPNGFRFHKRQRRKALCGTTLNWYSTIPTQQASNKALCCNGHPRNRLFTLLSAELLGNQFAAYLPAALHQPAALWGRQKPLL